MLGNEYGRPKDVAGEKRIVFTSLADAAFDVCFENVKTSTKRLLSPIIPLSHFNESVPGMLTRWATFVKQ